MDEEFFHIRKPSGRLQKMKWRECIDCKEKHAVEFSSKGKRCASCGRKSRKVHRPFTCGKS